MRLVKGVAPSRAAPVLVASHLGEVVVVVCTATDRRVKTTSGMFKPHWDGALTRALKSARWTASHLWTTWNDGVRNWSGQARDMSVCGDQYQHRTLRRRGRHKAQQVWPSDHASRSTLRLLRCNACLQSCYLARVIQLIRSWRDLGAT